MKNLFLPALIDLFTSRNIVSIFVDTLGGGAREDLSFELSNLADYLINVENEELIGEDREVV